MSFFAVGSWFKFKKRHVKIEHRNKRLALLILKGFYWSLFFLRRVLPRLLPLLSNREPPGTLIDPERVFLPPCGPIACKKSAWEPGVADERLSSLPKVEFFLKGSLDLISSPSVKIQIMGGKNCLKCKGKTFLFSTFCFQKFVDNTQQYFVLLPQVNFPAHNLKVMGSNPGYLSSWVFSTLKVKYFKLVFSASM